MPYLFVYLIKVNIALVIFCLGYYAVLRHLTFYNLNRAYLLGALLFSTGYPLVNLSAFISRHEQVVQPLQVVVLNWQAPVVKVVEQVQHNYWYWLQVVFWIGVALMALRLLIQLLSLFRIHQQSEQAVVNNYTVRRTKNPINPFSFWQSIYINPDNHPVTDLRAILEHEQIHVNDWHTLDILLGELSIVCYWFNPGVWLIKRAIVENIEFITDQKILQKGVDSKAYQYSLLQVSFNSDSNVLGNHFNLSTIKKRIIMMNSERSSSINLTRYALLLPAVLALVLVFSVSKAELTKRVSRESAKMVKTIKAAVTMVVGRDIADMNNTEKPAKILKHPKLMAHGNTVKLSQPLGIALADTIKKPKTITLSSINKSDSVIWILDGKVIDNWKTATIPPADIESIHVSKTNSGVLNGRSLVVITTKKGSNINLTTINGLTGVKDTLQTRYVTLKVNGKIITDTLQIKNRPTTSYGYAISSGSLNSRVTRIRVNGKTDSLYGKALTLTKNINGLYAANVQSLLNRKQGATIKNMSAKLIVIDGKEATEKQRKKLSADDIDSISLLTDDAATALYGDKAKNGVVVITTKKKN